VLGVYAAEPKVPPAPIFRVEESVPENVRVLLTLSVLPLVIVKVPVVLVTVKPL
jgi:hypothetical protein